MASIIVPRRTWTGDDFEDFASSSDSRSQIMVHMLPTMEEPESKTDFDLIKLLANDPKVIQEAFDWAAAGFPSDDLIHIVNSIRFVQSKRYGESSRYSQYKNTTHYFLEADTPEGRITFMLEVKDNDQKENGYWFSYWGVGSLAPDFLHFAVQPAYKAWIANAIHGALSEHGINTLWNVPLSKIEFIKADNHLAASHESDREMQQGFINRRMALTYPSAAEKIAAYPAQWHKVGYEMSGASLVTRIRQGNVEVLNPQEVEVKAVKGENGKYSVWVRRSTGQDAEVQPEDLDGQAELAWERFSESMKDSFIREFKLSHSLGAETAA